MSKRLLLLPLPVAQFVVALLVYTADAVRPRWLFAGLVTLFRSCRRGLLAAQVTWLRWAIAYARLHCARSLRAAPHPPRPRRCSAQVGGRRRGWGRYPGLKPVIASSRHDAARDPCGFRFFNDHDPGLVSVSLVARVVIGTYC